MILEIVILVLCIVAIFTTLLGAAWNLVSQLCLWRRERRALELAWIKAHLAGLLRRSVQ